MSEYVVNAYDWSSVAKADYGLWVAKYRDNSPDYNYDMSGAGTAPKVKWWFTYAMWQWTGSGRLTGYNGAIDCDVFYGDATAWKRYAGVSEKPATNYEQLYNEALAKNKELLAENTDLKLKIANAKKALE